MSPRSADPAVRLALIEEGARLIAEEGQQALSLRRLTRAVGVSTMAIYTHFGSMEDLQQAIRQEGFDRLAARMAEAERTDDPVADLVTLGWGYVDNGLSNANLYRAMFMEGPDVGACDLTDEVGLETFASLVAAVGRAIDAGRLTGDRVLLARQLWVAAHGCVSLAIAGHLTRTDAFTTLAALGDSLLYRAATDRDDTAASLQRAQALING